MADAVPDDRTDHPDGARPGGAGRAARVRARVAAWTRHSSPVLRVWVAALAGTVAGVALAGSVSTPIGPFDTRVSVRPGLTGVTHVRLGPLGSIELDTHDTPVVVELRVQDLRLDEAERIADDPAVLRGLEEDLARDARVAVRRLSLRALLAGLGGGLLGAFAAAVAWSSLARGAAAAGLLVVGLGGTTALTFDPGAVAEPRYTGLISVAPTAVGRVDTIVERFGQYRAQLSELVRNVVTLYRTTQTLPTFDPGDRTIQVLHVSDIHLNPQAFDLIRLVVDQFGVDAVVDTGDITDWGSRPEAGALTPIREVGVPYVWVRGNHDSRRTQRAVAANPNAVVLDGEAAEVAGLRFWGIGDPRYTPDKTRPVGKDVEREEIGALADRLPAALSPALPVDVLVVHDPRAAEHAGDLVPLILSGHTHSADERRIGEATLLVEGSTGGAGLRGLQGEDPEPLTCTVLYFDPETRRLVAYDRISVRGLGETGARVERHLVSPPHDDGDEAGDGADR